MPGILIPNDRTTKQPIRGSRMREWVGLRIDCLEGERPEACGGVPVAFCFSGISDEGVGAAG